MPPITDQDLAHDPEQHRSARGFVWPGLLVIAVLAALDLVGGLVVGQRVAANISGTFALAPALTALSRSPRNTLTVGVPAVLVAAALALYDQVPVGTGAVRTMVVVASVVLSSSIAQAQSRQWAQLQDRRQAARTLQAAMLTTLPRPDHLELISAYLPASEGDQVGGDWYDAVVDADGATILIIGDVVGHDIHAAAAMGQLRGLLRAYAIETTTTRTDATTERNDHSGATPGGAAPAGQSPAQLLTRADEAITRLGLDVLATVVVVRVEQEQDEVGTSVRRLRWSNAGHLPPMLLLPPARTADLYSARVSTASAPAPDVPTTGLPTTGVPTARVLPLRGEPDLLLGLGVETTRRDHVADFPVSSTLLLYTDGLVERRDQLLDQGLDRLANAMISSSVALGPHRPAMASEEARLTEQGALLEQLEPPAWWTRPGQISQLQRWVNAVLPATLEGGHQDDVAVLAVHAHPERGPRPPQTGPTQLNPGGPLL